jgi:hypothetical protein
LCFCSGGVTVVHVLATTTEVQLATILGIIIAKVLPNNGELVCRASVDDGGTNNDGRFVPVNIQKNIKYVVRKYAYEKREINEENRRRRRSRNSSCRLTPQ